MVLLLLIQDAEIHDWVLRLGHRDPSVREEATRELRRIGWPAVPDLRRALVDPDREVSERALWLLRVIPIRTRLSRELLEAAPGIDERLAGGDDEVWTEVYLQWRSERRFAQDLRFLAPTAVRGVRTRSEARDVLESVESLKARRAIDEIVRLLTVEDDDVKLCAYRTLVNLNAVEAVPGIAALARRDPLKANLAVLLLRRLDPMGGAREMLIYMDEPYAQAALRLLVADGCIGAVEDGLRDRDVRVRLGAVEAFVFLGARELAFDLLPVLGDADGRVRSAAARALGSLGARHLAPDAARLLRHSRADVRVAAMQALWCLRARHLVPEIRPLLADADPFVREYAAFAVKELTR